MKFKPFEEETLVSARTRSEIIGILSKHTDIVTNDQVPENHLFNGIIDKNSFRISLKISYPQNAIPLAIGKVEETPRGSIVFIKYQLFPATKVMLGIVGGILATICITFLLIYMNNQEPKYIRTVLITLATGVFYYMTLIVNFFKRKNQTRSTLEQILS